jgi:hypothetical protein
MPPKLARIRLLVTPEGFEDIIPMKTAVLLALVLALLAPSTQASCSTGSTSTTVDGPILSSVNPPRVGGGGTVSDIGGLAP